ncbi:MAG: hypothetical protein LV479_13230 [Methylacidiphilales bacterium]|nr:hypothetical protein [Candidatus Methylacidiphilales bacterium]
MSGFSYLRYFFLTVAVILAPVIAINYIADPAGIYHYGKSWDWIKSRPSLDEMMYIHKAHAVATARADILLLGTSRVANGLDPSCPALPYPAYNLGLHGGQVYESWRYFQHAAAAHVPRMAVLGVDRMMFSADKPVWPSFTEERLSVQPDGRPNSFYRWADILPTLLSFHAFAVSLNSLLTRTRSPIVYTRGYEADDPAIIEHFDLAAYVLKESRRSLGEGPPHSLYNPDGTSLQMDAYDHLISWCAAHHVRLIVFVLPLHASKLDTLTVDWNDYSEWMRIMLNKLDAQPGLDWEFWDFAGYNSMSTEPLPAPTDTVSHMKYYWEASHFRKNVGDLVLTRLFKGTGPNGFGYRLTPATVDQDLARLKAEKDAWHAHGTVSSP